MKVAVLTSLTAALTYAQLASALTSLSDWNDGIATFYGGQPDGMSPDSPSFGTLNGACGYGQLDHGQWPYWSTGALAGGSQFASPNMGCGMCLQVSCVESGQLGDKGGSCQSNPDDRSVVIMITDTCPQCQSNQLDIQALTWARIANPSPGGGRINIKFRRVECAPPSDLEIQVQNNRGGAGWIRLQITKAGGRAVTTKVELQGSDGGGWQSMNNVWGASWEMSSTPKPPLNIRVTDDYGNTVTANDVIQGGVTGNLPTSAQFKISDPSDVQPSGGTVGSGNQIQSVVKVSNSSSDSSTADGPSVQAFSGPPDTSGPSTTDSPSPSGSSPTPSSPSSSTSKSSASPSSSSSSPSSSSSSPSSSSSSPSSKSPSGR